MGETKRNSPGPWVAGIARTLVHIKAADGSVIGQFDRFTRGGRGDDNGVLAAAAPEMFEALDFLKEQLERREGCEHPDPEGRFSPTVHIAASAFAEMLACVRAAHAKATGGSR